MAALSFGHLPSIFMPSGPMASGLPNKEKVRIRQLYAEGKVDRMALLESKPRLTTRRVPVLSTVRPTPTRWWWSLWDAAAGLVLCPSGCSAARSADRRRRPPGDPLTGNGNEWMPMGKMFDEKVVVNGIVALLATGGPPTTPCTWWRWRARRALSLTGMISPTL
jgi:phosphogluconate dehydratase